MLFQKKIRALVVIIFLSAILSSAFAQSKQEEGDSKLTGTPVLWKAPVDLPSRDLFLGPGGEEMKPDLSRVIFESDETGGYSVKWNVKDGSGKKWVAKLGKESQAETAAVRLLWAVGYMTEVNYLVPCLHVEGAPKPRKKVQRCEGDGFANVRLKSRPKEFKKAGNWSWKQNPFVGTKEFEGLVVMMALLNNWDLKEENNKIFYVPTAGDDGAGELRYMVTDLGASFGQVKINAPIFWRIFRNRNDPKDYSKDSLIDSVKHGRVFFSYTGKQDELFDDIKVEDARWIASLLSKLSDRQIGDAFRAANYMPEEVRLLTDSVRSRINELAEIRTDGPLAKEER
ncbi:MAG TPA: hypothetical protein VKB86_17710 [Pyrinomonadaceae bacterium]|nr:hypothetical protein [Pyrinomonadaceae bacterium]